MLIRLHVMAGIAPAGDREECGKIYRKNLGVAAELLEEVFIDYDIYV